MLFRFVILPPRHPQYDENFLDRSKMTSRKQLVACPKNYLAANNEAEEDFNENVACTVQTITTQEDGFLSQDQRYMLLLNAMLIGAPVDHGHQPILVSLSNLYVDAKQIKNGMNNNNDKASTTEESQAIDLRLDSKIAESCSLEMQSEGSQNAAANQAFSPVISVVSKSVHLRCARKGFFKYIKRIYLLMLVVFFALCYFFFFRNPAGDDIYIE